MVSNVKQGFWKGCKDMKQDLKSFGLRWKNWLWKDEKEDDEMSRGYRRIYTYFTIQGIHQEIRSHKFATQRNPPKK